MTFRVLISDPPWQMRDSLPGKSRGAAKNYKCLSIDELCRFEIPPMLPDSVLFLWRLSSMPDEALRVARAWGFRPHSEIVWHKTTKNGKTHFGMGRIVRGAHETCLIAVRGKPKVCSKSERSIFQAPVGRHSEKPDAFYEIVRRLYEGPRAALFERKHREDFVCFGDELPENEAA